MFLTWCHFSLASLFANSMHYAVVHRKKIRTHAVKGAVGTAHKKAFAYGAAKPSWRFLRDPHPRRGLPEAAAGRRRLPEATWLPEAAGKGCRRRRPDAAA